MNMRMKEKSIRMAVGIIVIICLGLMTFLSACTEKPTAEIENNEEPAKEFGKWSYDGGPYMASDEKTEVVTAHADASGSIKEKDVSVSLKAVDTESDGKSAIREITNLKDITNKNGDEEFELKDGYLYFQNLGRGISYEGKGQAELPVNVSIRYFLDGEELSPEEIKGKKGHVRVSYKFENNEQTDIEVGGSSRSAYVPFAAVSVIMLEGDSYSNIETTDCELSSFDSEDVIMAMTMPGMRKNMDYLSADVSEDDIPESFAFEVYTESFELGFSTTIISTDLLDEEIDLSELSDIKKSLGELKSAGRKLANAGSDVEKGMCDFGTYLSKYTEGVDGLDGGVAKLYKGIKKLDKNKKAIYNGAAGISEGASGLDEAYAQAEALMLKELDEMIKKDPGNKELKEFRDSYEETYTGLGEQLTDLSEGSEKYTKNVSKFNSGIGSIKKGAKKLRAGSSSVSGSGDDLLDGYNSLRKGVSAYAGGVDKFYEEGIKELYSEGAGKINDIENFVHMMEKADGMYNTYSGLDEGQTGKVTFIIETEKI